MIAISLPPVGELQDGSPVFDMKVAVDIRCQRICLESYIRKIFIIDDKLGDEYELCLIPKVEED